MYDPTGKLFFQSRIESIREDNSENKTALVSRDVSITTDRGAIGSQRDKGWVHEIERRHGCETLQSRSGLANYVVEKTVRSSHGVRKRRRLAPSTFDAQNVDPLVMDNRDAVDQSVRFVLQLHGVRLDGSKQFILRHVRLLLLFVE